MGTIPLEGLALQPLLERVPVVQLADLGLQQVGPVHVEEPLVLVHPHLHRPRGVDPVRVLHRVFESQLGFCQKSTKKYNTSFLIPERMQEP